MKLTNLLLILVLISLLIPFVNAADDVGYYGSGYNTEETGEVGIKYKDDINYHIPGVESLAACQKFELHKKTTFIDVKAPLKIKNEDKLSNIENIKFELRVGNNILGSCDTSSTQINSLAENEYTDLICRIKDVELDTTDFYICVRVEYVDQTIVDSYVIVKSDSSRSINSKMLWFNSVSWQNSGWYSPDDLAIQIAIDEEYALQNADPDLDGVLNKEDNCWNIPNAPLNDEDEQLDIDEDCPNTPYESDPMCGDACDKENIHTFNTCPPSYLELFSISHSNNAHAELADQDSYSYQICMQNLYGDLEVSSTEGTDVISLSSSKNAHASRDMSAYPAKIKLHSTTRGSPECIWEDKIADCGEDYPNVVFSISDQTNAHLGNAQAYDGEGWVFCCNSNSLPEIDLEESRSAYRNQELTFKPEVTDAESDPLTYKWEITNPDSSKTDGGTGKNLRFTPGAIGEYILTFSASDCNFECTSISRAQLVLTVANHIPEITAISIKPKDPISTDDLICSVSAEDADNQASACTSSCESRVKCKQYNPVSCRDPCKWDNDAGCIGKVNCEQLTTKNECESNNAGYCTWKQECTAIDELTYRFTWSKQNAEKGFDEVLSSPAGSAKSFSLPAEKTADRDTWQCTATVTDGMDTVSATELVELDNSPPTAGFSAPEFCIVNRECSFTSTSTDLEGELTYSWDLGDTSTSTDESPAHTYTSAGNFTVKLTVIDTGAQTAEISIKVPVYMYGDFNFDKKINYADLGKLGTAWGATSDDEKYDSLIDYNKDSSIDFKELGQFGKNWGINYEKDFG